MCMSFSGTDGTPDVKDVKDASQSQCPPHAVQDSGDGDAREQDVWMPQSSPCAESDAEAKLSEPVPRPSLGAVEPSPRRRSRRESAVHPPMLSTPPPSAPTPISMPSAPSFSAPGPSPRRQSRRASRAHEGASQGSAPSVLSASTLPAPSPCADEPTPKRRALPEKSPCENEPTPKRRTLPEKSPCEDEPTPKRRTLPEKSPCEDEPTPKRRTLPEKSPCEDEPTLKRRSRRFSQGAQSHPDPTPQQHLSTASEGEPKPDPTAPARTPPRKRTASEKSFAGLPSPKRLCLPSPAPQPSGRASRVPVAASPRPPTEPLPVHRAPLPLPTPPRSVPARPVRASSSYPKQGPRGVRRMCFSGIAADERETLSEVAKTLFGRDVVAANPVRDGRPVTHVVYSGETRTVKLLLGVAWGAHIVTPAWLYKCMDAGGWLAEDEFVVPRARDALARRGTGALLRGHQVWVAGTCEITNAAVARLVVAANGNMAPVAKRCSVVVVGAAGSGAPVRLPATVPESVPCVTEQWLLDSVERQAVAPLEEYAVVRPGEGKA